MLPRKPICINAQSYPRTSAPHTCFLGCLFQQILLLKHIIIRRSCLVIFVCLLYVCVVSYFPFFFLDIIRHLNSRKKICLTDLCLLIKHLDFIIFIVWSSHSTLYGLNNKYFFLYVLINRYHGHPGISVYYCTE